MGGWRRPGASLGIGALAAFGLALALTPLAAQQVHRTGFEGRQTLWERGPADAEFVEKMHGLVEDVQKNGQRSELIHIEAKAGSFVHYVYRCPKAPIGDELLASLWVRADRPGAQIMARVVLPYEPGPAGLEDRMTVYIKGDAYRLAGRWQRLEIGKTVLLARQQQQLLQLQLKRTIDFKDAYVDQVLLNVYGGPGVNQVWTDDLEIGPTIERLAPTPLPPPGPAVKAPGQPAGLGKPAVKAAHVEFDGNQLTVDGRKFFIRGIRHTDTPLNVLRTAGFNTLWVDHAASPAALKEAADSGLWLAVSLPTGGGQAAGGFTRGALGQEVTRLADVASVLCWDLGNSLAYEQAEAVGRLAQAVRAVDPGRPLVADVWDGLQPYSRNLNLVGSHRWPLMTGLELTGYRQWLEQRRRLATPGAFLWSWVQTHTPELYARLLYEQSSSAPFKEPIGPQPEQIRLLTYTALGAGCRGVAFWSDRFLADSHQGRDRLLCLGLLNQELQMLEPLLLEVDGSPQWVKTSDKDVQAAVFRTTKGVLVLPMWLGKGGQFVPGQAATAKLSVVVPQAPPGTQAWEVTPGEVRGLGKPERVPGGTKVTLPDFGLTTAIVFTSDVELIDRFQRLSHNMRPTAAQWTYEMAAEELKKAQQVQQQLDELGKAVPEAARFLQDAQERLQAAKEKYDVRAFTEAYREAQRALRPVRIVMRAQWEKATKMLDSPTASPYAVSYFTLPKHWRFIDKIESAQVGANVLPGGDFEAPAGEKQGLWSAQETTLDEVTLRAERVTAVEVAARPAAPKNGDPAKPGQGAKAPEPAETKDGPDPALPREGRQCLKLEARPKAGAPTIAALERTFLAMNSPALRLPPGSLVRISGWVCVPHAIKASVDGALLYDSAGGEPLALRLVEATPWRKFTLYRQVPANGTLHVTLALTGLGSVYFDDVRVEPLQ